MHFHLCERTTASKGSFQTLHCLTVPAQICDPGRRSEPGKLRGRVCWGWQPGAQSPPVPLRPHSNGPGLEGLHSLNRLPPACKSCPARSSPPAPTRRPEGGVFRPVLAVCPTGPFPAQPSADQHQARCRPCTSHSAAVHPAPPRHPCACTSASTRNSAPTGLSA